MSNLRHWLWLSTRGAAPGMYAARLLEHFGTPERAYFADPAFSADNAAGVAVLAAHGEGTPW